MVRALYCVNKVVYYKGVQAIYFNSYKSYYLTKFKEICLKYKIITLYMPLYLLYLLQPLNISYFLLLKRIYSTKIIALARYFITYITKLNFLLVFKTAYIKIFIVKTIKEAFRGARLILYNLDIIILRLNIYLYIPN